MALSKIDSEIEQVDQEKYLRQATSYYQALEKPLKYGPEVNSLSDLVSALHREFESNYVNIEMVNHLMLSYKSNPREWRKYAKFDRYTYTRNLVDAGNGKFNLLILCWGEGHGSSVHDHADSHCFMKMLKGDLREKRYEYPNRSARDNGRSHHPDGEIDSRELVEIGETPIAVNDVAYINGEKIRNFKSGVFLYLLFFFFRFVIHRQSGSASRGEPQPFGYLCLPSPILSTLRHVLRVPGQPEEDHRQGHLLEQIRREDEAERAVDPSRS